MIYKYDMIETGDHHLASKIMEQPCICESPHPWEEFKCNRRPKEWGKKTVGVAGRGIHMTFERPMQNFQTIYAQKMCANEQTYKITIQQREGQREYSLRTNLSAMCWDPPRWKLTTDLESSGNRWSWPS